MTPARDASSLSSAASAASVRACVTRDAATMFEPGANTTPCASASATPLPSRSADVRPARMRPTDTMTLKESARGHARTHTRRQRASGGSALRAVPVRHDLRAVQHRVQQHGQPRIVGALDLDRDGHVLGKLARAHAARIQAHAARAADAHRVEHLDDVLV